MVVFLWWCFCGGVLVVVFLCWYGGVFCGGVFCGGVLVVVFLCWYGGVFVVVFLRWCSCGGVFVVVFLGWCLAVFLWWCSCRCVCVVVFLWWCLVVVFLCWYGGVFVVVFLWRFLVVVFLWWYFCGAKHKKNTGASKTSFSRDAFDNFNRNSVQNNRFVRGFRNFSRNKLPKRAFRARLPTNFTERASKTSVSRDASDNFHRKSFQKDSDNFH